MTYTEIRMINGRRYYYRVLSVRNKEKISKNRVYLGCELFGKGLLVREKLADEKLLSKKINKKNQELGKIKTKIIRILKKNNIKRAGIFGSYARGEQKKNSDLDIVVEPPKGIGFGFVTIAYDLEKELGKKVDLLTYKGINPRLKGHILAEELRII